MTENIAVIPNARIDHTKRGSAPESDKIGISSCFPESHKFGSGCG
jgi:hypothetical protein